MKAEYTFYRPEEIAKMLNFTVQTIYVMCRTGRIPAIKVGKCYRISREEFRDWLSGRRVKKG